MQNINLSVEMSGGALFSRSCFWVWSLSWEMSGLCHLCGFCADTLMSQPMV